MTGRKAKKSSEEKWSETGQPRQDRNGTSKTFDVARDRTLPPHITKQTAGCNEYVWWWSTCKEVKSCLPKPEPWCPPENEGGGNGTPGQWWYCLEQKRQVSQVNLGRWHGGGSLQNHTTTTTVLLWVVGHWAAASTAEAAGASTAVVAESTVASVVAGSAVVAAAATGFSATIQ